MEEMMTAFRAEQGECSVPEMHRWNSAWTAEQAQAVWAKSITITAPEGIKVTFEDRGPFTGSFKTSLEELHTKCLTPFTWYFGITGQGEGNNEAYAFFKPRGSMEHLQGTRTTVFHENKTAPVLTHPSGKNITMKEAKEMGFKVYNLYTGFYYLSVSGIEAAIQGKATWDKGKTEPSLLGERRLWRVVGAGGEGCQRDMDFADEMKTAAALASGEPGRPANKPWRPIDIFVTISFEVNALIEKNHVKINKDCGMNYKARSPKDAADAPAGFRTAEDFRIPVPAADGGAEYFGF